MSQKKLKEKRRLLKTLDNIVKQETYRLVTGYCKNNEKPFEEMNCLEQVGIVMNAKSLAEKSLSKIIRSGGK